MSSWRNLLVAVVILVALVTALPGCLGKPEPTPTPGPTPQTPTTGATPQTPTTGASPQPTSPSSPAAQGLSNKIAGINPAQQGDMAGLLGAIQELENARGDGTISEGEEKELKKGLTEKFSNWVRERVDEINPKDPYSLKYFFWMQQVQQMREWDDYCDPETKKYKEGQMKEKFNEWVRNRVDEIDPSVPSLKPFFDLQLIQESDKYEEYATADTTTYKEQQMKQKFNEWVRNRVDELDPNDPDFLKKLEELRLIQETEKYEKFATAETRAYKEKQLKVEFGQYVTKMVNNFSLALPNAMQLLNELRTLQGSDVYEELCPEDVKKYKEQQLATKLVKLGVPGEPPHMVVTLPRDKQTDVPVNQYILITFDQPIMPPSVQPAIRISPATEFTFVWLEENAALFLEPVTPMKPNTTYRVDILQAVSLYGIPLKEGYSFSFTTKKLGETPHVVGTVPINGQLDASAGSPIEITFDQPMEPASVAAAITISPPIEYDIFWDGNTAVLQLLAPMEPNTSYTVNIGAGAISPEGLLLKEGYSFSFITGIVDPPQVVGIMPVDRATGIPSNHPIMIVFSQTMDPASLKAAVKVSPAINYSITWLEANLVLVIQLPQTITPKTTITIEIGSGAMSAAGLPLRGGFSFSFTTEE